MKNYSIILGIMFAGIMQGCSIGMALSGKKNPNLGVIKEKVSRAEIEAQLGTPVMVSTHPDGYVINVYEYEIGNEPSVSRAVNYLLLDVITLGLWEIVGISIEDLQGKRYQMSITYNENDEVVKITSKDIQ